MDGDRKKAQICAPLWCICPHKAATQTLGMRYQKEGTTVCRSSFLCCFSKDLLLVTDTYKIAGKRSFDFLKLVWFWVLPPCK